MLTLPVLGEAANPAAPPPEHNSSTAGACMAANRSMTWRARLAPRLSGNRTIRVRRNARGIRKA